MNSGLKLKLLLVGDVMLGRLVNDALWNLPAEYPWGDTLPLFRDADWRACNLECVISDIEEPWARSPKTFYFRSDAKNIAVLKAAGINAVSLANNHTLDHGYGAMSNMLQLLEVAGIAHAGAGANRSLAMQPAVSEVAGMKIGLLSFTDNQADWEAQAEHAGICYVPVERPDVRTTEFLEWIAAVRARVDVLIVAAHWGPNWSFVAPKSHLELARDLIGAGASIIFGHSPHVVRGIEIYRDAPILYSAGDFIDDYAVDEFARNDRTFVFVIEMAGQRVSGLKLYPTIIREFQALRAADDEAPVVAAKMIELCGALGTSCAWNETGRCLRIDLPAQRPEVPATIQQHKDAHDVA